MSQLLFIYHYKVRQCQARLLFIKPHKSFCFVCCFDSGAGKKSSTLPNDFKPGDLNNKEGTAIDSTPEYTPPPKGAMAARSNFVVKMRKWKAGSGSSS